jgi:hypothetical protein
MRLAYHGTAIGVTQVGNTLEVAAVPRNAESAGKAEIAESSNQGADPPSPETGKNAKNHVRSGPRLPFLLMEADVQAGTTAESDTGRNHFRPELSSVDVARGANEPA